MPALAGTRSEPLRPDCVQLTASSNVFSLRGSLCARLGEVPAELTSFSPSICLITACLPYGRKDPQRAHYCRASGFRESQI